MPCIEADSRQPVLNVAHFAAGDLERLDDALTVGERDGARRQAAVVALVSALAAEPSFWTDVEAVCAAAQPVAEARRRAMLYGGPRGLYASRRDVVATVLLVAANGPAACARVRLYALGAIASWTTADAPGARAGSYRAGTSYAARLDRAAGAVAATRASRDATFATRADVDRLFNACGPLIAGACVPAAWLDELDA